MERCNGARLCNGPFSVYGFLRGFLPRGARGDVGRIAPTHLSIYTYLPIVEKEIADGTVRLPRFENVVNAELSNPGCDKRTTRGADERKNRVIATYAYLHGENKSK